MGEMQPLQILFLLTILETFWLYECKIRYVNIATFIGTVNPEALTLNISTVISLIHYVIIFKKSVILWGGWLTALLRSLIHILCKSPI